MILQKYLILLIVLIIKCVLSEKIIFEAENGLFNNTLSVLNSESGYSGNGYVGKFEADNDVLIVNAIAPSKGIYNITISYLANKGKKTNIIIINDIYTIKYEFPSNNQFEEVYLGTYYLDEGENTIVFQKSWGWMYVDYFAIEKVSDKILIEAESGILNNKLSVYKKVKGYSGIGYVGKFETDEDILIVNVNTSISGFYNLTISYLASSGKKTNEIVVNEVDSLSFEFPYTDQFEEIYVGTFYFNEGDNTIEVRKDWGYMYIDYFAIEKVPDEDWELDYTKIDRNLVNRNATTSAIKLYNFLRDNYGKKIISGQTGKAAGFGDENPDQEIDHIYKVSNRKPALWNTDFVFKSKDVRDRFSTNNFMTDGLNWWQKYEGRGIMSIQWHWNMKGQNDEKYSYYSKNTTFDIEQAIIENTWEYNKTVVDIDYIAGLFRELQDVNMPVIFRPLHENDGDWFWWGGPKRSKACAELWKLLYHRLVDIHKINNIIWLWNGKLDENTPKEYIDLVGVDIYSKVHGTHGNEFMKNFKFFEGKKMVVLSENGRIPDIDKCVERKIWWGYFMTWNNEFILSEQFNNEDYINKVYNNKYVITMDDLPSFNIENTNFYYGDDDNEETYNNNSTTNNGKN
eukprot:jgi/Orpsp1_1/1179145/evm.model.c7180000068106.1